MERAGERKLRATNGANRNGHARRSIRRSKHVAAPVENSTWVDHHARRMNFARHDTLGLDLNAAFGKDDAVKAPCDHDSIALDLAFDARALAEHHGLLRDNVAFDFAVDAERAFELQRTLKRHALIDKA